MGMKAIVDSGYQLESRSVGNNDKPNQFLLPMNARYVTKQ